MVPVILAQFLDDCWEPEEAAHLLSRLAKGDSGQRCCLRVAADGARLVGDDFAVEEPPGAATYLWALWRDKPPTVGELVALHDEHVRVTRGTVPGPSLGQADGEATWPEEGTRPP
jgi:hypothetical protein